MIRFYSNTLPIIDEIVRAIIIEVNDKGFKVELPDYENVEGLVAYNINSRMKKRNKKKNSNYDFYVGKELLLIVIAVNKNSRELDLSRRNIDTEEMEIYKNKTHVHMQAYGIFRYIYMKIKGITDISLIDDVDINNFMTNTFWEVQNTFENEDIISKILNKSNYNQVLELINFDLVISSLEQFKQILDHYIDTKFVSKKKSVNKQIKLGSYCLDGLNDIKYILDYESYVFYPEIATGHNIDIKYINDKNDAIYIIHISQKEASDSDIESIYESILNEIVTRAQEKNAIVSFGF